MSSGANALESSKPSRYLREHRLRLTIWIGAIEGLLTLLGLLPHLAVYILAAVAIGFWAIAGRRYESPTARHLSWIFAASQAIAVLIPSVLHIAKWIAVSAVILAAGVGLIILFTEREKP
jgi:FtsH-binding integral membrane protein